MKRLTILLGCALLAGCASGGLNAEGKAELKVLYVGGNPDYESFLQKKTPEEHAASVKERMEAFGEFLRERFDSVAVIEGSAYKPELSEGYDVTVFDGKIPAIKPAVRETDAEGNIVRYVRPQLLPEDFDCAAVTIGSVGEDVGRAIGSKNDWYCLCLDAQAHHMVEDHPIFKGPFRTKLTLEKCPTPEDAFHYTYYYDGPMPDSIMMWRVQTKGYKTDEGFPIGMVSRPWGYTDSPDAEYISSGVCAKTLDAVAIGRHGNFLTWGFAASPAYLTEEAKAVLANAICYIARFKGKGMLVRKYNDRIATREYLRELTYLASMEPYEERVGWTEEANREGAEKQAAARAKKARGEKLSDEEAYYLNFKPQRPMTLEEYLKRYEKEAFEVLGTDLEAYPKYYAENRDYFYGGKGMYVMTVDEDCKAWGIANNDIRLLEKAVSCLEQGQEVERAKRVLRRYTLCTFTRPEEWRQWLDTSRDKIFFTESGGWFFMVDGPASLPGNDYHAREKAAKEASAEAERKQAELGETSQAEPVAVAARMVGQGDSRAIEVRMRIHPGFHVYRQVGASDPYIPLTVEASLPEGCTAGELIAPAPQQSGSAGTTVYENEVTLTLPVKGNGTGTATCTVGWQSCDDHVCTPPQTREFTLRIE